MNLETIAGMFIPCTNKLLQEITAGPYPEFF